MDNKVKQLEEISGQLCDGYCKYPTLISDEDKLEEVCMKCPLNQIFELLSGEK